MQFQFSNKIVGDFKGTVECTIKQLIIILYFLFSINNNFIKYIVKKN